MFYSSPELRAGWRLLIFLAIVFALVQIDRRLLGALLYGAGVTISFLAFEISDFLIFLFASWIMGRIEDRTIADYGLPWRRMFRIEFWQGSLIGFASLTALLIVMRAFGTFHIQGIALHGSAVLMWAAGYAVAFVLVALREEFRARGYGLFALSATIGFWPAALISAAYFGYSHQGNSGEDWVGLVNAGAFGLLLCFLLRRTGNLWLPIGFHMAFDWGESYFYGVADSGQVLPGHLLNSSSSGPPLLSGGSVGPEGSILCTLLIVVVWAICAVWLRDVKYPKPQGRASREAALPAET